MITREDNRVTVNLTWPSIIWMAFWGVLALVFHSAVLVFIAVLPLFFLAGFLILFVLLLLVVVPYMYMRGIPLRVTWRGREKVYRRGRR